MKRNFFLKIIAVTSILILTINIIQCSIKTKAKIEKIDELMNYCYRNKIFNGTILVAENEKVIYKKASGIPFHEFLKNNIFNSLGMNNSLVFD